MLALRVGASQPAQGIPYRHCVRVPPTELSLQSSTNLAGRGDELSEQLGAKPGLYGKKCRGCLIPVCCTILSQCLLHPGPGLETHRAWENPQESLSSGSLVEESASHFQRLQARACVEEAGRVLQGSTTLTTASVFPD